jgi:secreted Zn-dependent insulinase-like peptidase
VKDQGIEKWLFNEQTKLLEGSFLIQKDTSTEPLNYVEELARSMQVN